MGLINIEERWEFHAFESILGIIIGDINNNGQKEIISFTNSGKLIVISLNGKKINEFEISENSSIWQAKVSDIDGDTKNEIVLGGLDGLLRTFRCTKSYELKPFWAHQFGASISGFLIADVNSDNINEIVAYSIDKSIRCLNSLNGSLLWGQLFEDGIGDATIWQDSEDPLVLEIIACGNDGTIRSYKGTNGDLLWFKRFKDKIRCVSNLKTSNNEFIVCGGDDKRFHVFEKNSQKELKTLQFDNLVWKCASFLLENEPHLLVNTYSFDYFDDSIKIADIVFNSRIVCLNSEFEKVWEIRNINVETFIQIEILTKNYIIIGTTKGNILFLEPSSGNVITEIKKNSCVNDIRYYSKLNVLLSCHDDGSIFAYFIGNL
jgi:WD40 repeat protein